MNFCFFSINYLLFLTPKRNGVQRRISMRFPKQFLALEPRKTKRTSIRRREQRIAAPCLFYFLENELPTVGWRELFSSKA